MSNSENITDCTNCNCGCEPGGCHCNELNCQCGCIRLVVGK